MTQVIEAGIGRLNYGKQTLKGTIAVAATTTAVYSRVKWFDGMLGAKATLGEEEYIDGNRFGSPSEYVDVVGGSVGTVTIQSQPTTGALFLGQLLGKDTVTGSVDPWTHTITSGGTSGSYGTWWQRTGETIGPIKEAYFDSKISKLAMTCSDKQNPMHYAMDILCLQPAETYTTEPAKTEDASDPYYWTESEAAGVSKVELDGVAFSEVNEEVLEIDTGMKAYWGNSQKPSQLVEGKGTIVRAFHMIATDEAIKKSLYGEEAPAAGKQPAKAVFYAVMKSVYEKSATRKITFESPRVAIDAKDLAIGAQREGGEIPLVFAGKALKGVSAEPALTVVALSADETSLV
jgi:hypothetical protein